MNLMEMGLPGLGILFSKIVLGVFSVASVAVMIERALTLSRVRKVEERDYRALKDAIMDRRVETMRACVAASPAPCAGALQAGLSHQGSTDERVSEAIAQEVDVQNAALHNFLPLLATIASTAPYVGLFGTVLGILEAFDRIAKTGQTGASTVAGPIAEALITTALGLGVAIPAVMAYNFLSGRANDLSLRVETHSLDLAARLPDLGLTRGSAHSITTNHSPLTAHDSPLTTHDSPVTTNHSPLTPVAGGAGHEGR